MLRKPFIYYLLCCLVNISCSNSNIELQKEGTDFCSKLHSKKIKGLTEELKDISHLTTNKTGVYVLEDGGGSMVTRAWLTESAEQTIDVQYFIFSVDNIGLIACDYLVRAADRGVKVRILIDDIMVNASVQDLLALNSHDNISIKIYNPNVNIGKNIFSKIKNVVSDFRGVNQRMHNKILLVDDKVVITGGRNIADEYFDYDHEYNFRDRDILLIGKEVSNAKLSFNQFWTDSLSRNIEALTPESHQQSNVISNFDRLHEYACNPDNFWPQVREKVENLHASFDLIKNSKNFVWLDSVSFISDNPGKNDGSSNLSGGGLSTNALKNLIKNAKSSIDIQTPYLITTKLSQNLLKDAINRGVRVRILTNSLASTDNLEAFSRYQSDRELLLNIGVNIYEFRPDATVRSKVMTGELHNKLNHTPIFGLHAKSMVIDGKTTVIGTFNFDPRSANLNTECIVIVRSVQITEKVLEGMETEFRPENSWKITESDNPDYKVSNYKQFKTWTRKVIPKEIL